jgi:hypothetical protein
VLGESDNETVAAGADGGGVAGAGAGAGAGGGAATTFAGQRPLILAIASAASEFASLGLH